jgi:hypothetical protein
MGRARDILSVFPRDLDSIIIYYTFGKTHIQYHHRSANLNYITSFFSSVSYNSSHHT